MPVTDLLVLSREGHVLLGSTLGAEPLSQDHCAFHGDHAVLDSYTGAVYDAADADPFSKALGDGKALILKHHGLLTVGETVDEAAFWLHLLERCCQTMLLVAARLRYCVPNSISPEAKHDGRSPGNSCSKF